MGLITCPDCGQQVSDRAKTCIHCGCPLEAPNYEALIKMPKPYGDQMVGLKMKVYDDATNRLIAETRMGGTIRVLIDKPMNLRFVRGLNKKGIVLGFQPKPNAKYMLTERVGFWSPIMEVHEVDVIDAD